MRDTLYFTLPDVETAEQAVEDLLHARVEIPQIRCLARPGMPLGELPEAGILRKADVMHGAGTGIAFGGVIGGIIGGLLVLFPPRGTSLEVSTMLIAAVAGAVFCVWALSIARMVVSNPRVTAFKHGDPRRLPSSIHSSTGAVSVTIRDPANRFAKGCRPWQ
jgi:hypothetical protein